MHSQAGRSEGAAHIPGRLGRPLTRRPAREPGGAVASVRDSCHPFTGMARPARLEVGMAATSAVPTDAWEGRSGKEKGADRPPPSQPLPSVSNKKPRWLPGLDGGAIPALTVAEFSLPRCALSQCAGAAGSERIPRDAELSEPGQGITRITRQFPSVQPIMGSHPIGKAPGTPVFGVKVGHFVNAR